LRRNNRKLVSITPRNDPRAIPVIDPIPRIEADGGLICCAANEKVVGSRQHFVFAVDPNDFERSSVYINDAIDRRAPENKRRTPVNSAPGLW
jgi:hypothetical protein